MNGRSTVIRIGLLLVGLPAGLAGLGVLVNGPIQNRMFGISELAVIYLLAAGILMIILVIPYIKLFHQVRTAAQSTDDAEDGETIAITGDLVADGTIRSPVEQTPVALTAWQTDCSQPSAGDDSSNVSRDVQGRGIYSVIGAIRPQQENSPLEVDIPSTLTKAHGRLAMPTFGELFDSIAYQSRLNPGITVEGLAVIVPGRTAQQATTSGDSTTEDVTPDSLVTAEWSQYPTGEPPRQVRAFVGEHRRAMSASSSRPGLSTPSLEYVFGVSAPAEGHDHEQTSTDGGERARSKSDTLDRSTSATFDDETTEGSRFLIGHRVKSILSEWYTTAREKSANKPTHTVQAWGFRERATVTMLGTYRTGGYTDERVVLSEDRVDLLVAGNYDGLYQWARRGLLGAAYATACFGVLGAIFLV